ncbi:MAG: hypothetical protein M3P41_04570, partial [Actinomycetota bacterium]|nr:hypothetical protein [Actinomycetota bacterium]
DQQPPRPTAAAALASDPPRRTPHGLTHRRQRTTGPSGTVTERQTLSSLETFLNAGPGDCAHTEAAGYACFSSMLMMRISLSLARAVTQPLSVISVRASRGQAPVRADVLARDK